MGNIMRWLCKHCPVVAHMIVLQIMADMFCFAQTGLPFPQEFRQTAAGSLPTLVSPEERFVHDKYVRLMRFQTAANDFRETEMGDQFEPDDYLNIALTNFRIHKELKPNEIKKYISRHLTQDAEAILKLERNLLQVPHSWITLGPGEGATIRAKARIVTRGVAAGQPVILKASWIPFSATVSLKSGEVRDDIFFDHRLHLESQNEVTVIGHVGESK